MGVEWNLKKANPSSSTLSYLSSLPNASSKRPHTCPQAGKFTAHAAAAAARL